MPDATIIVLLGAESTGKSTLADALAAELAQSGIDVAVVPEVLREFCQRHGRVPTTGEQPALADAQTERIRQAAARHALVIADTSALMTAVYSETLFADMELYAAAVAAHRHYDLTLVTGLDLPWAADGIMRDGAAARDEIDARLRAALQRHGLAFSVVYGTGGERTRAALAAVLRCLEIRDNGVQERRWRWSCRRCADGSCLARGAPDRPVPGLSQG